jgi:lambda repressor-like predicted transcriptional regulator
MLATVKQILRDRRMSQADLARRMECSRATVCRVLSGSLISPFHQTFIAEVLGIDPQTLWGEAWWFPKYKKRRSA